MENNPIGFIPNDIEIITYLAHKASGESLPSKDFIHIPTIDVYGNREPWELLDVQTQEIIHFFTNLKIENRRKRDDRSVGAGAWKICPNHSRYILDLRYEKVGLVNRYEYRNPSEPHHDWRWILDEYTLAGPIKGCVKSRYKGLRFCTLTKITDFVIEFADMRLQRIFDLPQIKSSRKRKAEGQNITT